MTDEITANPGIENATADEVPGGSAAGPVGQDRQEQTRVKHGAEWGFFTDVGKWSAASSDRYRKAVCNHCQKVVRSKLETMASHIRTCRTIPPRARSMYNASEFGYSVRNELGATAEDVAKKRKLSFPGKRMFPSKFTQKQNEDLSLQIARAFISTNTSFNVAGDREFIKLLQNVNGSIQVASPKTIRGPVMSQLANLIEEEDAARNKKLGFDVTISVDGWKTPSKRKLSGYCRVIRRRSAGNNLKGIPSVSVRLDELEDVTVLGENEDVIKAGLEKQIKSILQSLQDLKEAHAEKNPSRLVGVVTDSAACNIKAKKVLSTLFPNIMFLPCFAHQLNLFAGNLLSHPSCSGTIRKASTLVTFFNTHSLHMALLKSEMVDKLGEEFEFVVSGETRWFSHYGQILSIFKAKAALESYKKVIDKRQEDVSDKVEAALDIIGTSSFWKDLSLISILLRPITIEIAHNERRNATLSDVSWTFGRLWAMLKFYDAKEVTLFDRFPMLIKDLLTRLEWRFNVYYDTDLLILAIALDPRRKMQPLAKETTNHNVYEALKRFAEKYGAHIMLPDSDKASKIRESLTRDYLRYYQSACSAEGIYSQSNDDFSHGDNVHDAWEACLEFDVSSPLRLLAALLFSVCTHAADLERIWSAAGLIMTSRRRRISLTNILRILNTKLSILEDRQLIIQDENIALLKKRAEIRRLLEASGARTNPGTAPAPAGEVEVEPRVEPSVADEEDVLDLANSGGTDAVSDGAFNFSPQDHASYLSNFDNFSSDENEGLISFIGEITDAIRNENLQELAEVLEAPEASNECSDNEEQMEAVIAASTRNNTAPAGGRSNARRARRLPNYRLVTVLLSTLFDFDTMLSSAEESYGAFKQ